MPRATWARRGVASALGLALLGLGAFRCGNDGGSDRVTPARTATVPAASPGAARYLTGVPMSRPTHLRLLMPHWYLDVDAIPGTAPVRVGVTGWLPLPGDGPLLIEEVRRPEEFGQIQVSFRREPRLPGTPPVVRVTAPALARFAASRDAAGVRLWVAEYHDQTRCILREVDFSGADLRPPRPVACGTNPIGETAAGLWVDVGPDAFAPPSTQRDHHAVLVDPATLSERARFPRVELVDDHRVVVFPDLLHDAMELRDLRTGQVMPLTRPTSAGHISVWPVSPDRRYLPFSFDTPESHPQRHDLWLLDLATMGWLHLPSMPAYTALKRTSLAWAQDGRLVLLGEFDASGPLLVTWRPGDVALALLPYQRPATSPDQPSDDRFLILPTSSEPGG